MTPDINERPYTQQELNILIDMLMLYPLSEGFQRYEIRGQYVSPAVIECAINERLEKIYG